MQSNLICSTERSNLAALIHALEANLRSSLLTDNRQRLLEFAEKVEDSVGKPSLLNTPLARHMLGGSSQVTAACDFICCSADRYSSIAFETCICSCEAKPNACKDDEMCARNSELCVGDIKEQPLTLL